MPPAGSLYAPSPLKQHNSLPKLERLDDDKRSTLSRASGVPRAEHALDILQLVAGNRVRHASCAPEFLEEIASKGAQNSLKKSPHRTFKIIHGSEARSYFKEYVRGHPSQSDKSLRNDHDNFTKQTLPSPIVFAVTAWEGETKCVDYYMTWRGKKNESSSEEYQREVDYLDAQFRRLAKGLDKEYKSISALRTYSNLSKPRRKLDRKSQLLSQFPDSRTTRVPPGITISAAEEASPLPTQQSLPEPPVSASDSVMSLPLLNMIRGVPFSHRVPLRVTNPDRLSLISDITIAAEETTTVKPQPSLDTSNTLVVPTGDRSSKHGRTLEDTVNASSASIRSSDTRSSKSSRSSRSSTHYGSENSRNPSPDRESRSSQRDRKIPEYLIVLLGDKYDTDPTSWHGLERNTSVRSLPAERHSLWMGPVASSKSISRRTTPAHTPNCSDSEDSGDDEGGWKHTPVIPLKPFMEAMGLVPSSAYYNSSPPVVPGGLQYQLSVANTASPRNSHSPYLYGSPRMESSSPYVPAWVPPLQPSSKGPSRPPSRASYGSPYVQAHNPF